jgi:hypothetical protein
MGSRIASALVISAAFMMFSLDTLWGAESAGDACALLYCLRLASARFSAFPSEPANTLSPLTLWSVDGLNLAILTIAAKELCSLSMVQ